jgi:predicted GNAT family acetyltransferase
MRRKTGKARTVTAGIDHRPETWTQRLRDEDAPDLSRLLDTAPDYTLFLGSNFERFGLEDPFVHFWGTFQDGHLVATLMMSGQRAGIYALDSAPLRPLMDIARRQRLTFLMGPREMVRSALASLSGLPLLRSESHIFANLLAHRFQPQLARLPGGASVRRATPDDIEALTTLYTGAAGFERAPIDQVRQAMVDRVYSLRTYVVETQGRLVSAAATSAETLSGAMIGGVWTLPGEREHGYSTKAVAALSAELLAEGRQPSLFYLEDNAPAAHVYKKIGFQEHGRWTVVYFDRQQR